MVQIGVGRARRVALGYLVASMVIGKLIEPPLLSRGRVPRPSSSSCPWCSSRVRLGADRDAAVGAADDVVKILLENEEESRWGAVLRSDSKVGNVEAAEPPGGNKG